MSEELCNCPQCKRYEVQETNALGGVTADILFDGVRSLKEINTYTEDGAYLASSIDSAGNKVYYVYNTDNGLLNCLSSADTEIDFSYDAMGKLTKLAQDVSGLSNGTEMANEYGYTDDRVTSITHNGFSYEFDYDMWGNQTAVRIGERKLTAYTYGEEKEDAALTRLTYANGQTIDYTYNAYGQIAAVSYDGGVTNRYEYAYDADGTLISVTDTAADRRTVYTEDGYEIMNTADNSVLFACSLGTEGARIYNMCGENITVTESEDYDSATGITEKTKIQSTEIPEKDTDGAHSTVNYNTSFKSAFDWFGRTTKKDISLKVSNDKQEEFLPVNGVYTYGYADTDTEASNRITAYTYQFTGAEIEGVQNYTAVTDRYEYDGKGNITGIYRLDDGVKTYTNKYYYDEANQLIREDYAGGGETILYTYDKGGNIVSRVYYPLTFDEIPDEAAPIKTVTYGYDDPVWHDVLTSYNGMPVKTDALGNITELNGVTYAWTAGRQLKSTQDKDHIVNYYYNADGYISKVESYNTATGEFYQSFEYFWDSNKLIGYSGKYDNLGLTFSGDDTVNVRLLYDAEDELQGAIVGDGLPILFEKNLQGDIVGFVDGLQGAEFATMTYDAYGAFDGWDKKPEDVNDLFYVIFTLYAIHCPFFYRGYLAVQVGDSYCYYLGSRFYSPELGRFLNADVHTDTQQGVVATNMFAYCNNNPVMNIDPNGEASLTVISKISRFILGLVSMVTSIFGGTTASKNKKNNAKYDNEIKKDYIYNQNDDTFKNIKFGIATMDRVGCEIIAVYNAFFYFKKKQNLSQIIYDFETHGLQMLAGEFGSNPNRIGKYLDLKKCNYTKCNSPTALESALGKNELLIVSFWNESYFDGLHTVAVEKKGVYYYAWNFSSNAKKGQRSIFTSLEQIHGGNSKYIVGYVIHSMR